MVDVVSHAKAFVQRSELFDMLNVRFDACEKTRVQYGTLVLRTLPKTATFSIF